MTVSTAPVWHLYIVRTRHGTLYTGIATDVDRRLSEHDGTGRGARYLRGRRPFRLVYRRRIGDRAMALKAEHRIKRLSRAEKDRLIAAKPDKRRLLKLLALNS